jgi:hypothetical protein
MARLSDDIRYKQAYLCLHADGAVTWARTFTEAEARVAETGGMVVPVTAYDFLHVPAISD